MHLWCDPLLHEKPAFAGRGLYRRRLNLLCHHEASLHWLLPPPTVGGELTRYKVALSA